MITIENNQALPSQHTLKVGDFYGRFDDNKALYLVTKNNNDLGYIRYGLTNITSGQMYSDAKMLIHEIFGNNSDKFYLITKDIKIIIG